MDTSILKKFAPQARNLLIDQVSVKLRSVLASDSAARREQPKAVTELEKQLAALGEEELIEKVAYTWFNRLSALRFMDANGLNTIRAVTPADGQSQPEILAEAMAGHIDTAMVPEDVADRVRALLSGAATSSNPQAEAYQLLLVAVCNAWHSTMPFMFERIADYTELLMPTGLLAPDSIMVRLREVMTDEACEDVEIIGWLYQFYISEKKDEVFAGLKKNKKITAENIPAATQLFTPHWIVRYLVENSLGRLWMLNHPNSRLVERMEYYIAPEEPETDFLRISSPEEIRICDPACGSGHMLTYAFDLLYAIYEEQGYEPSEIPPNILLHNLTGIEIDDRAGALAAFALAMKAAAKLGRRRFTRVETRPDIVVLQNVAFSPAEMQDVADVVGDDLFTDELRETLAQFKRAKNFGSLIVPKLRDPAETLRIVESKDFASDLLLRELQERVVESLSMAEALSSKYHVVVANPPYMISSNMNSDLKTWSSKKYKLSKSDLYAMFMERSLEILRQKGLMAMINMQSWMFLSSFEALRSNLLSDSTIISMAHLGERSFDTIGGSVVSTTAFVIEKEGRPYYRGDYFRLVQGRNEKEKAEAFLHSNTDTAAKLRYRVVMRDFGKIPGTPIAYWVSDSLRETFPKSKLVGDFCDARIGMATGKNDLYVRQWHEVSKDRIGFAMPSRADAKASSRKWFPYAKGGEFRKWAGNEDCLVDWESDGYALQNTKHPTSDRIWAHNFNLANIFAPALCWTVVTTGPNGFRFHGQGFLFDAAAGLCQPKSGIDIDYLLGLLNSKITTAVLPLINPTLNLHPGYLKSIPGLEVRQIGHVQELRELSKLDWDSFETSWDFMASPLLSSDHRNIRLEATYNSVRGRWRDMTEETDRLEQENNRIFIDAYGLQDELTPEVAIEEITLSSNPAYRYGVKISEAEREKRLLSDTMAELLSYAVGCMFGRYSLDEPGLILANQGETLEDYFARVPSPSFMPDEDNVIPILEGDWFADDITGRFRTFLRTTFGEEHFAENLRFIEGALGKDIRKYFLRDFYNDHVKRYKKRPIYWLFSSPKGSFNALIYMHRYRPDTVSVVLNDYLREYIRKLEAHREQQERIQADPSSAASARTKAAREIEETSKVLVELEAYEKDVLYPLATQRVEIDLDDGVKANYPKFGAALKRIPGLSE